MILRKHSCFYSNKISTKQNHEFAFIFKEGAAVSDPKQTIYIIVTITYYLILTMYM